MSKELPVDGFKWKRNMLKFNKDFIKNYDEESDVVYIRALKQALNHGLILKKVHEVTRLNQKAWLKPCIYMNTK